MSNFFISRELVKSDVPLKSNKHIEICVRSNVVSHATYDSAHLCQRGRIYGRRARPGLRTSTALARCAQLKIGVDACHYRLSGAPPHKNDGKILVFQSGNAIRAGKHSHEDALRCMFKYNQYVRQKCGMHHEWHTAIDNPNMVLSGRLKKKPSSSFKDHWRCNYTPKFPGVAVKTDDNCSTTPEVYPRSGELCNSSVF